MATIGKKTNTAPEVGDLVTAKSSKTIIYENSDIAVITEEVPSGTNLGEIIAIMPHETGVDVYVIDKGAVFADEVTTKVNPLYNYGSTEIPKSTGDTNKGFWDAFTNIFNGVVGVLTKKKTTTTTDEGDNAVVDGAEETTPKKSTTWIWLAVGGVALTGIIVALAWPKKKKPETTPQQPIVIGK